MGLQLCELLGQSFMHKNDCMELADPVSRNKQLVHIEGVSVRTLEDPAREPVHVWIDFSRPEATLKLLEQIETPVVIATTGFTPEQVSKIENYAKKHPVLLAANTSPGMNLIYAILHDMPIPSWATEVIVFEEHHRHKKDSPSGTAKELVSILNQRGIHSIQIHAVRGGSTPGIHRVRFLGDYEEVEFSHRVSDRKIFARGALLGGLSLLKKKEAGLFTMQDLLKEKL